MHVRVFRDLAEAGFEQYDHGFGDAEFKRTFGTHAWTEATITCYGGGLRPRYARAVQRTADVLSTLARASVSRLGLTDALKRRWRRRLRGPAEADGGTSEA
jgi:CelD/BcsL family acetyltransferase involved in cellulose biosynthesis